MECDFGELNDSTIIRVSRDIRRQIQTDIGSHVTPSMGLSSSNLLAKIAAEMNKPNGFEILHPKETSGPARQNKFDLFGVASRENGSGGCYEVMTSCLDTAASYQVIGKPLNCRFQRI